MIYRLDDNEELTDAKLAEFIVEHDKEVTCRLKDLQRAYNTDYPIFNQADKPKWKPDNRIAVNFAKYIVDTMNGFFAGHPVKTVVDDGNESVEKYVELVDQYNDMDDKNAELAKICSIYGRGYEMYYVDETGNIGITYLDPMESFMIYDDSVLQRELYFVRLYKDKKGVLHGSISDDESVRWFTQKGQIVWGAKEHKHGFDGVPATEYVENEEQLGIFEPVLSMINAYNKAISEKANDVDYFADAYLKILGAKLGDDDVKHIRDDRVINFEGDTEKLIVDFLQKPNGDTTQEHLIDRLEKLIFHISMVANMSEENFGTSSGIAMRYKMLAMSNLEKTKERKFASGMNRRYKLIFSNPVSGMRAGDWIKVHPHFTPNFPANVQEEAQIARDLDGIVSQDTQLSVLSIVDNVAKEIEKMQADDQKRKEDIVTNRMFGGIVDGEKDEGIDQ